MAAPEPSDSFGEIQKRVIELAIRLGVLFILIFWCFAIIEPFVLVVAWAAIVAVALYPRVLASSRRCLASVTR